MKNKFKQNKTLFKVLLGTSVVGLATAAALSITLPIINSQNVVKNADQINDDNIKTKALGKVFSTSIKCISQDFDNKNKYIEFTKIITEIIKNSNINGVRAKWVGQLAATSLEAICFNPTNNELPKQLIQLIEGYYLGFVCTDYVSDTKADGFGYALSTAPAAIGWGTSNQIDSTFKIIEQIAELFVQSSEKISISLGKAIGGFNEIHYEYDYYEYNHNDYKWGIPTCDGIWASIPQLDNSKDPVKDIFEPIKELCLDKIVGTTNTKFADPIAKICAYIGHVAYRSETWNKEILNIVTESINKINTSLYTKEKLDTFANMIGEMVEAYSIQHEALPCFEYLRDYVSKKIFSYETTDLQAQGIGLATRSGFISIAKQPEAIGVIQRRIFDTIKYILANDEKFAIAYGLNSSSSVDPLIIYDDYGGSYFCDGALFSIARQPEAGDKIYEAVEFGKHFINLCDSKTKAEAISMLTARATMAIAKQPEAYSKILGVVGLALNYVVQKDTTDTQAYWICQDAINAAIGISFQPEALGKIKGALQVAIGYILNEKSDLKIAGLGQAAYNLGYAIATQPEAEGKIRNSFELTVKAIESSDESIAMSLGETCGGNVDSIHNIYGPDWNNYDKLLLNGSVIAIAIQPEAEGKIMKAADVITQQLNKKQNSAYVDAVGKIGAELTRGIANNPEAEPELINLVIEWSELL